MIKVLLALLIVIQNYAFSSLDNLVTTNWNGIDVVWIQDETLPTYHFYLYSDTGSFGEKKNELGVTEFAYGLLTEGTSKMSQKQISEKLEFLGVNFSSSVTHEYSLLSFSGLEKDIDETVGMFCHLVNEASFSQKRVDHVSMRARKSLENLVSSHSDLANRVFRQVTLAGTPYSSPTGGTLNSLSQLRSTDLKSRWNEITKKSYKKIYVYGPKRLSRLEELLKPCGLVSTRKKAQSFPQVSQGRKKKTGVYFVSVPNANQAQVRWGRYLNSDEAGSDHVLNQFSGSFLGGGFTSRLMQELRVKNGLVYSAFSVISSQKNYGRNLISTATKNESVTKLIKMVKSNILAVKKSIPSVEFKRSKNFIKGNYVLSQEASSSFLSSLIALDHLGRDYSNLIKFPSLIDNISSKQLGDNIYKYFNPRENFIFVLGDSKVKKQLRKHWAVKELQYKDYL